MQISSGDQDIHLNKALSQLGFMILLEYRAGHASFLLRSRVIKEGTSSNESSTSAVDPSRIGWVDFELFSNVIHLQVVRGSPGYDMIMYHFCSILFQNARKNTPLKVQMFLKKFQGAKYYKFKINFCFNLMFSSIQFKQHLPLVSDSELNSKNVNMYALRLLPSSYMFTKPSQNDFLYAK